MTPLNFENPEKLVAVNLDETIRPQIMMVGPGVSMGGIGMTLGPAKQKKMDLQPVANPSRWVCIPLSVAVHPDVNRVAMMPPC